MEITEVLQAWAPLVPVVLAPAVMALVQKAKSRGVDPFIALGALSVTLSIVYAAVAQFSGPDVLPMIGDFLIKVGGTAVLIYNLLKKYYPSTVGK